MHTHAARLVLLALGLAWPSAAAAHAPAAHAAAARSPQSQAPAQAPATKTGAPGSADGTPAAEAPAAPPDPSLPPDAFAVAVAKANLLEITLGKLAVQRAETQEVKDFGHRMATNHTAIAVIIGKIAAAEGISLPTALDAEAQATVAALEALQGVAFDKAYMTLMAERHANALTMFKWQYDNCASPALKPFAMQTMPIMGTHARLAGQLNGEVNKEELRLAAEQKAAELKAAEMRKAEEAAIAAAAAAKKSPTKRTTRKPTSSSK